MSSRVCVCSGLSGLRRRSVAVVGACTPPSSARRTIVLWNGPTLLNHSVTSSPSSYECEWSSALTATAASATSSAAVVAHRRKETIRRRAASEARAGRAHGVRLRMEVGQCLRDVSRALCVPRVECRVSQTAGSCSGRAGSACPKRGESRTAQTGLTQLSSERELITRTRRLNHAHQTRPHTTRHAVRASMGMETWCDLRCVCRWSCTGHGTRFVGPVGRLSRARAAARSSTLPCSQKDWCVLKLCTQRYCD